MAFVAAPIINHTPDFTKLVDFVSESSSDGVSRSFDLAAAPATLTLSTAQLDVVQVTATGAQTLTIPDGEIDGQTIVLYSIDAEDDDITVSITNSAPAANVVLGDQADSLVATWVASAGLWVVSSTAGLP